MTMAIGIFHLIEGLVAVLQYLYAGWSMKCEGCVHERKKKNEFILMEYILDALIHFFALPFCASINNTYLFVQFIYMVSVQWSSIITHHTYVYSTRLSTSQFWMRTKCIFLWMVSSQHVLPVLFWYFYSFADDFAFTWFIFHAQNSFILWILSV